MGSIGQAIEVEFVPSVLAIAVSLLHDFISRCNHLGLCRAIYLIIQLQPFRPILPVLAHCILHYIMGNTHKQAAIRQAVEETFSRYDINHSGLLELPELAKMLKDQSKSTKFPREQIRV